ncbi:hypothetical protein LAV72_09670 [Lysinibacillus xylanilyticus]|uniref:hypothetical protein n=1 Tax=Lysinibacillus xylanilyticus TaxID=582475 RepID=UPI002B252E91|nr:hypothetical protein [Lysinibacillus xylanilyticus]MEB2299887.1 hypothetical protein [Lysinibacillus xylanilyticus]
MLNINALREWSEKHSVEKRTIKWFWRNLTSYEQEEKEEFLEVFGEDFNKLNLKIALNKIALYIDEWNKDSDSSYGYDYVISYVPIVYNGEKIGEYRLLFTLDGESFDDFFVIY